ncbi:hypothetical protein PHLCEN_2v10696 [Hermanssonia centrifuga]|uniref:Bromo domain-containing protein n=1 Tax=Hermanssonia centrifuga TaxID=98765 RepID=A0A2R6NM38_9APHY|nr:hypothetical protein PHLCEN_2v10696 [Hermanssonia centrifuga]
MASSKSAKHNANTEANASNLTNLERLILAQAVYEFGSDAWVEVSKLLTRHRLILRPKSYFTPQVTTVTRKLAGKYYVARVQEIQELIDAEDIKFKKLVSEIDQIRDGQWDDRILGDLGVEPQKSPQDVNPTQPQPDVEEEQSAVVEEVVLEIAEEVGDAKVEVPEPMIPARELSPIGPPQNAEPPQDVVQQDESSPSHSPEIELALEDSPHIPQGSEKYATPEAAEDIAEELEPEYFEDAPESAPSQPIPAADTDMQVEVAEDALPVPSEFEPDEKPTTPEVMEEQVPETELDVEMAPALEDGVYRVDAKRKASEVPSEPPPDKKRVREESEPMDEEEPGPSMTKSRNKKGQSGPDKKFQNVIGMLHSGISQHRYGNIFHNPIKKSEAPDYHDIVKRPMDLKTIKARVKDGLIANSLEFQRDVYLMFANAMMYNRPGSEIYNMAEEIAKGCIDKDVLWE